MYIVFVIIPLIWLNACLGEIKKIVKIVIIK